MRKQKERNIHLDNMLLYILRQWKVFVIGIIAVGIVFAGIGFAKVDKKYKSVSGEKHAVTEKVKVSGSDLTNVDMILYLEQAIANQKEYNDKSILMKIRPREKRIATIKYQFRVSKDIAPELYESRLDQGEKAYQNVFSNNELYEYIKKSLSLETEEKYLKELVGWEMDSVGVIVVSIVAPDDEMAQRIREAIKNYLHENNAKILKNYKDLAVKVDSEQVITIVDMNLQNTQTAQYNNLLNLQTMLEERNLALSDNAKKYLAFARKAYKEGSYESGQAFYREVTAANKEMGSNRKIYEAAIYTMKRVLLFIILSVIWFSLRYMWSSKLVYAYDLWEMYSIKVLELLSGTDSGSTIRAAEKITANISDGDDVLVISSNMEKMDVKILENIKETLKSNCISAKIMSKMDETDTFKTIKKSKNIIIVESVGKSKYSDIEKCIDNIYCLGKEVIGAIVIG